MNGKSQETQKNELLKKKFPRMGVVNTRVIDAVRRVKRELFLSSDQQSQAYADQPLPIAEKQTISQPSLVAYMTQKLDIRPDSKILEIGTGSGYQTAILAELAKEVYTVEVRKNLSHEARTRLKKFGYTNIFFKIGNGAQGWKSQAPFDGILVTAAAAEIPLALIEQLKINGKMIVPVGTDQQELFQITKTRDGFSQENIFPVRFVPLVNNQP